MIQLVNIKTLDVCQMSTRLQSHVSFLRLAHPVVCHAEVSPSILSLDTVNLETLASE